MEKTHRYSKLYSEHRSLQNRNQKAQEKLDEIQKEFSDLGEMFNDRPITIFCAGSLGRGDVGKLSDLDLFILSDEKGDRKSRLREVEVLASIININRKLGFKEFSNDGQYLKFYSIDDMLKAVGSPRDDSENLFTARMLLLLESKPICNALVYEEYIDRVIDHYFRDYRGKRTFRPLFLINDILRYWRTLCLNYELIRDDPSKPWRKKNINLKFSRMLTVFGTLLPLISQPVSTGECVKRLTQKTPNERFALGLDSLNDDSLENEYTLFLDHYEVFVGLKESMGSAQILDDEKLDRKVREDAKKFSDFIYKVITHSNIDPELVKYLVL